VNGYIRQTKTLPYSLGRHAVRIQFEGSGGERYTIKLEGSLSKDKVMRVMDMYELLAKEESSKTTQTDDTLYGKVQNLISEEFMFKRFTSDQIRDAFEDTYNQPMKLAAISTYLLRMNDQNLISRSKRGRKWVYTLAPSTTIQTPSAMRQQGTRFSQIIDR
jgi:hypothetical protein